MKELEGFDPQALTSLTLGSGRSDATVAGFDPQALTGLTFPARPPEA